METNLLVREDDGFTLEIGYPRGENDGVLFAVETERSAAINVRPEVIPEIVEYLLRAFSEFKDINGGDSPETADGE